MPEKLDRCVASVIASGKTEEQAHAICAAQFSDSYRGNFNDAAVFDPTEKTAVSVRDGVLEYLGAELGMQPADKIFTVYRSPATIANTAMRMRGLPITDEHVALDMPAPSNGGFVSEAEMVDATDAVTVTTIAIRNKLAISDTLLMTVEANKRELSLGYNAELVPHDEYDFEQRDITPHHLAVVDRGRCGAMCSFIDRLSQPNEKEPVMAEPTKPMLHPAFRDAEGTMNLQQIVELATALPEAIKSVPVDQLQKLLPALQQIVEAAKGVMPEEEPAPAPTEEPVVPAADADPVPTPEEKEKEFSDAVAAAGFVDQKFVDAAVQAHTAAITKAQHFLDEGYVFEGKSTAQVMRDALATDSSDEFADAELPLAFKMLKKPAANYTQFGDGLPGDLTSLQDKEL